MAIPYLSSFKVEDLHFDRKNPRLAEFSDEDKSSDEAILKLLWEIMAVDEIVLSIAASGFFPHEQLIVMEEKNGQEQKWVVVEGNRRLAAVKAILAPSLVEGLLNESVIQNVPSTIKQTLHELPAIKVSSREEAWRFIGFKHINGAAKWSSYAKAQYIAQIHKEFGVPLVEIALQIGDTNHTVQKLYQSYRVIQQAEEKAVFDTAEVLGSRLFFSHLYNGLGYEGIQKYLQLQKENLEYPIPEHKLEDLGEFLVWLFGNKSRKTAPIVQSQNPDLRRLDAVLKNNEATILLKNGSPLVYAYEVSQPKKDIFEQSLVAAKKELQKANSYSSITYDGSLAALQIAGDIAELADALYEFMEKRFSEQQKENDGPKKRVTS